MSSAVVPTMKAINVSQSFLEVRPAYRYFQDSPKADASDASEAATVGVVIAFSPERLSSSGPSPLSLSVVIPVYNEEAWIGRSIAAVLDAADQADLLVEVIVVDDGSTDSTPTVVDALAADTRVRRITQANAGRMAARLTGVKACSHTQMLLLDARVIIQTESLRWISKAHDLYPEASVWCGHVDVETRGNPVAAFWSGLTKIGWRRYISNPALVSFGAEDFDAYPKGTTALLINRDYFVELAESFESLYDVQHLSSDDTRLLRRAATERRIWLSPDFAFTYHGKSGIRGFRRQAYFRGTTFVDGYLGQSRALGVALIGATVVGLGLVALTFVAPRVGIPALAVAWALVPAGVAASGGNVREIGAAAAFTPAFAALFGSGVLRGYSLAIRSSVQARRRLASV